MIRVQAEDFDIGRELENLSKGNLGVGGVSSFVGLVRDMAGDESIQAMTLEHYPEMTEKALAKIEAEARSRWPLEDVLIIHRYGRLEPGDRIVLVAAAAAHREAAIEACHFLIDWLTTPRHPYTDGLIGSMPALPIIKRLGAGSPRGAGPKKTPTRRSNRHGGRSRLAQEGL